MIHMYTIPTTLPILGGANPARMVYLTNSEVDNSGKVRAIHNHTDIAEIGFVYYGHGIHYIEGKDYYSKPGDLLIYNTNVLHQDLSQYDHEPMRFFLCGIRNLHIEGFKSGYITMDPESYLVSSGPYFDFIRKGFESLEYTLSEHRPEVSLLAQGFLQSLLAIVKIVADCNAKHISNQQTSSISLAEEIRQYIDCNYTQNFSLDDLAQVFHINRFHASHVFSQAFGISPMQYRTRRRIGEAQSLLTSSDCSITYIASAVGYDDPNRFSQVFSKTVGMSASKYRDLSVRTQ